jgi:hypothetical protein
LSATKKGPAEMSMTAHSVEKRWTAHLATLAAGAIIAHQVGGKAARDALFLTQFSVSSLPLMMVASAALSVMAGVYFSRAMTAFSPVRVLPAALWASAFLSIGEWCLSYAAPKGAAVLVFLHIGALGSVLISGLWSMLNERFDPHAARKLFAHVAAGASLGGLLGGVLAQGIAAVSSVAAMLPCLALLHLSSGFLLRSLQHAGDVAAHSPAVEESSEQSGLEVLQRVSYLRNLGFVVLAGTISTALIDYVFKAQAAARFTNGEELLRFFGLFYTSVSFVTLIVQVLVTRVSLDKLGLARTVASLPAAVFVGSVGALFMPGLASAAIGRAGEAIFRSSMFRSGYELFYTPVPREQKRAAKPIIDVGFERLADAIAALAINIMLLMGAASAASIMLCTAIGIALIALLITRRLGDGYVQTLEDSLRLLDRGQDSTIRRHIPNMPAVTHSEHSVRGFTHALFDRSFDVRFLAGIALAQIRERQEGMPIDHDLIMDAVHRELSVDVMPAPHRNSTRLQHVFRLLSLVLPGDPLRVAYRLLLSDDVYLNGTALEYLELVLPSSVRRQMWPLLIHAPRGEKRRSYERVQNPVSCHDPCLVGVSS